MILLPLVVMTLATEPARPSEDELFGAPPSAAAEPSPDNPAAPKSSETSETSQRGQGDWAPGQVTVDRFATGDEKVDPLQLGGLFYQRFTLQTLHREPLSRATVSAPMLVDGYLDARPSEEVRGFLVTRLTYDPTLDGNAGSLVPGFTAGPNPSVLLDQLWLRFHIANTVFVTAGKQHAKWGTARFWNPTDYLHERPRDALALFDDRTGTTMVKLHVPIERLGWNFYTFALLDGLLEGRTLGSIGGAARAEVLLGETEVGLDAVLKQGQRPRYGLDLSSALGPLDVYGEVGWVAGPVSRWRLVEVPDLSLGLPGLFEQYEARPYRLSAAAGATYTHNYSDTDTLTVGAEYFFNDASDGDARLYSLLLMTGEFRPFYLGRHYLAAYALLPGPGTWDKTNFILSLIGNLSDRTVVARLDFTVRVLTYLTVESYVGGRMGAYGGEFRFGVELPPMRVGDVDFAGLLIKAPVVEGGLALRLDL